MKYTDPNTGEEEQLWDLDLICFGTPTLAMESGVNLNGNPCFDNNGHFNKMKISPFSTFKNASQDAAQTLYYWDFQTQTWR